MALRSAGKPRSASHPATSASLSRKRAYQRPARAITSSGTRRPEKALAEGGPPGSAAGLSATAGSPSRLYLAPASVVEEPLQASGVGLRPPVGGHDAGPPVDVVRRVDVSEARRRAELIDQVGHGLHAGDDGEPAGAVRHVEPAGSVHPFRGPPDRLHTPEGDRVGRVLEVHDPWGGP